MRPAIALILLLKVAMTLHAQETRQVTFISDTLPLKGTLTIPEGSGPHPGVVMVHGSGPNDRDQLVVLDNKRSACLYPELHGDTLQNFRELAVFFQQKGLATLRYDKRTFTHRKKLDLKSLTPQVFIRDALAAVDYLKAQPEVDQGRIVLAGHSQGANLLPPIAKQAPAVKGLIAMATPSTGIDTVLARQVKRTLTQCADSVKALVRYERILYAFEKLRNNNWPDGKPLMNAYPGFWKSWLALTDTTVRAFRQVQLPTLFLNGTADYNVPPRHLRTFQRQLPGEGYAFERLKGVNHFLTFMDEPVLAEPVKEALAEWLAAEGFRKP